MEWQEISGSWIYLPQQEIVGIVHFLGGAFVATAPQLSYRLLLEQIGKEGYVMVATPFLNTFEHGAIARDVLNRFETVLDRLQKSDRLGKRYLPIYGIGHSMGCKLHLLIGSLFDVERAGNILISFNNYPASRAIPFMEQLKVTAPFDLEFTPSPQETEQLIIESYAIRRNLLIKFTDDNIDQTILLNPILRNRFSDMVALLNLPGNHLTPISQELRWQGEENFNPLQAISQWIGQGISRDLYRLKQEILIWLNPMSAF